MYHKFAQRIAAVDEQPALRRQRRLEPLQGDFSCLGMTPVQRADAHRNGNVEMLLVRLQLEILDGDLTQAQPARCISAREAAVACATALAERSIAST